MTSSGFYEPYKDELGQDCCGAKRSRCKCGFRYRKSDLTKCPKCGVSRRCDEPVAPGSKRCKHHGGSSKSKYGFGRREKIFSESFLSEALEHRSGSDFLLGENILAIHEAELTRRLENAKMGAPTWKSWMELGTMSTAAVQAMKENDQTKFMDIFKDMVSLIRGAGGKEIAWREAMDYSKTVDTTRSRVVERAKLLQEMVTASDIALVLHQFEMICMEVLTDRKQRREIAERFRDVFAGTPAESRLDFQPIEEEEELDDEVVVGQILITQKEDDVEDVTPERELSGHSDGREDGANDRRGDSDTGNENGGSTGAGDGPAGWSGVDESV